MTSTTSRPAAAATAANSSASCRSPTTDASPSPTAKGDRKDRTAMLPVPPLPRPVPLRTPVHSGGPSVASSPPRKKLARAESPTTVAVAGGGSGTPSGAAALRLRCESCRAPHDGSYGSGRFCAVHCARRTAAALKWSKKRAARASANSAAHSQTISAASSTPRTLPPIPPESRHLGKRPLAVVAPAITPQMSHIRPMPFAYAHPSMAPQSYALLQPPLQPHLHPGLVPLSPAGRTGATGDMSMASGVAMPYSMPMPMQLPFSMPYANCYAMPYGGPYVPVHMGPVQMAPVASSISAVTRDDSDKSSNIRTTAAVAVNGSEKSDMTKCTEHSEATQANDKGVVQAAGGGGGMEESERKTTKDSAVAAQLLLSMRGE